ncbi:MAG: hypothetical protein KAG20_00910, partial [Cocleimonas sp.]|nr:hypothetical protein [Cocleimonas sp.]
MKLRKYAFWLAFFIAILVATVTTHDVFAHTRIEVGPYTVVVGWVEEPVIVGERNALLLEVYEGDRPVTGMEGSLNVDIEYA